MFSNLILLNLHQFVVLTKKVGRYQEKGFSVLGFPCNQFGGQEPGTNDEIENFVCTRFKTTFPLFDKVIFLYGILRSKFEGNDYRSHR